MLKTISFFILFLYGSVLFASELPDSIQGKLDKAGTDTGKIQVLLAASNVRFNRDPDLGIKYASLALALSQKNGNKLMEAQSYYRLGTNTYVAKTLDQSLKWFLKAAALYDSLHNLSGMASSYSAIADLLGDEGDAKKSIEYYRKAKEYFMAKKDTESALFMDMSVSATLGSLHLIDSALYYSLSILPAAERTRNADLVNMIIGNIGGLYYEKKDYEKALDYYFKSLPYFEKRGDKTLTALGYSNIAAVYLDLKDYPNAEKYALMEYENYKQAKSRTGIVQAMELLGKIYMEEKNYEKAAQWYQKSSLAKDSLFKSDIAKQVAEMQAKYETEKKDKALALQNAKLDRQQLIINGSIGFLVLILGAGLILLINYRKINKLSKALSIQKVELEELNSIKDKLFSAISHDLRSPLGRITNMLYMMQRGSLTAEKLKERTSDFLGAMHQTMQMLDNLLYWASGQMRGLTVNKSNVNIGELIEENLELMQPEASLKNIEFIEKVQEPAMAIADINMTRLILRNLINNAIKFTPENGSVKVSAAPIDGTLKIEVSDTGTGISKETIDALNAGKPVKSSSGTNSEKGFGIGLQLCKDFIEKNGGHLEIHSTPGEGSTFSFTLPIS